MAEPKKKPTLRKAPKGGVTPHADVEAKAQRKAAKEAAAQSEAEEKAAAKEAIAHAKAASKGRKAEAKAAAKAEKQAAKEARAEERARRKSAKAAAAAAEAPAAGGRAGAERAPERGLDGGAPFDERLYGDADLASERTTRFVSGDDAYDAPPEPRAAGTARGRQGGGRRRVRWGRVLGIVLGVLLAALVAVVAAFSWNRWLRYDDAADFQGTWTYGGDAALSVTFDGSAMVLTKDASYEYQLDTFAKTVSYRFGELSGSGCYAFSEDRNTLVIVDGRAADAGSILGLVDITQDAGTEDDGTSTVIVLKRAGAASAADAASAETSSGSAGSQQASSSETASDASTSDVQDAPAAEDTDGQGAAVEQPAAEAPAEDAGPTTQDLDSLGDDPGAEAGANVVTPEDLGLSSSETESQ